MHQRDSGDVDERVSHPDQQGQHEYRKQLRPRRDQRERSAPEQGEDDPEKKRMRRQSEVASDDGVEKKRRRR